MGYEEVIAACDFYKQGIRDSLDKTLTGARKRLRNDTSTHGDIEDSHAPELPAHSPLFEECTKLCAKLKGKVQMLISAPKMPAPDELIEDSTFSAYGLLAMCHEAIVHFSRLDNPSFPAKTEDWLFAYGERIRTYVEQCRLEDHCYPLVVMTKGMFISARTKKQMKWVHYFMAMSSFSCYALVAGACVGKRPGNTCVLTAAMETYAPLEIMRYKAYLWMEHGMRVLDKDQYDLLMDVWIEPNDIISSLVKKTARGLK